MSVADAQASLCQVIAADAASPEASSFTLGFVAPLTSCRSHQVMLSTVQVQTARLVFMDRRNRPIALAAPVADTIARAMGGTLVSSAESVLTFEAPLVVAYSAAAHAFIARQLLRARAACRRLAMSRARSRNRAGIS